MVLVPTMLARFALVLGFVGGAIAFTLGFTNPPPAVGEGAPAADFSSSRALKHLSVIAQRPHPVGSAEHQVVFDYLVDELSRLHGPPEIQTSSDNSPPLQNILVRLKGSNSGSKALMLTAHYDSVASSPGASDNGAGVVTLLETLRALKAGAPLKNDVIFFFTDGEELGVLGLGSSSTIIPGRKMSVWCSTSKRVAAPDQCSCLKPANRMGR